MKKLWSSINVAAGALLVCSLICCTNNQSGAASGQGAAPGSGPVVPQNNKAALDNSAQNRLIEQGQAPNQRQIDSIKAAVEALEKKAEEAAKKKK